MAAYKYKPITGQERKRRVQAILAKRDGKTMGDLARAMGWSYHRLYMAVTRANFLSNNMFMIAKALRVDPRKLYYDKFK